jgi:two-component system, NtrC family, sensor kinase
MIGRLLPPDSLRTRILLTTAGTITAIMMIVSWGILAQWRETVLAKERQHAIAVTRAFSVTVTEAMIFEGNDLAQSEGFLDTYIAGFMLQDQRLRYIAIAGPGGETVTRSLQAPPAWQDELPKGILSAPAPATWFRRQEGMGWIQEVYCPLVTGHKRWGSLVVGIEAESVRHEITRIFYLLFGLAVIVTSLMILILWVLLGRLLGSLRDLVRAMDSLELEGSELPSLPERRDEIGVLFRHFQGMRGRLIRSRLDLLGAQDQIYHAERLAAIGRLASGIAHELNNPINGVRNCIYAIRHDPENREKNLEYLQMMDEGMEQAASVITKLLGFARKQDPARVPVSMNAVVRTVARLLSFDLERKRIALDLQLQDDLPQVTGDSQLLQEVLMNLLLNSIDAVGERGYVRVRTRTGDEGRVEIEVSDRGRGISEADLPRIFDPFFTTKGTGEGTGLGLSVSLGIVQAHGGAIDVTSRPGVGTAFTVSLPAGGDR